MFVTTCNNYTEEIVRPLVLETTSILPLLFLKIFDTDRAFLMLTSLTTFFDRKLSSLILLSVIQIPTYDVNSCDLIETSFMY